MYEILKLNKISPVINNVFTSSYDCNERSENPDGIILRSYNMADYPIGDKLLAVGRAGAGVNNIPLEKMSEKGVVVFNTPGANANAVKELVLCGMFLASRDIIGGINWVNTLTEDVAKNTEKCKGKFGGYEIFGKKLGVIGLGAIGILVANACAMLGMKVYGYDPYLTEKNKSKLDCNVTIMDVERIFRECDFITLHVPLCESTKEMINAESLMNMKNGVTILNMSRAGLVNVNDIKEAVKEGKVRKYVVDFPTEEVLNCDNIIVIPHLGASTEEAEDNCAVMAANSLKEYLENGNIINSVNFPDVEKEWTKKIRTAILFKKSCAVINSLPGEKIVNEKGGYGYALIDTDTELFIPECENIIRIRTLIK